MKESKMAATLPPPGDQRRDVLKARTDDLAEAVETASAQLEGGRIDPAKLRVEPELAQHFNELEVSRADPAYEYLWAQSGFNGRFIKLYTMQGWEVVQGDAEEAQELRGMGADSTRRLGDVILLRMRKDRHKLYRQRQETARRLREESVAGSLVEMSETVNRSRGLHTRVIAMSPTGQAAGVEAMHPETMRAMETRAVAAATVTRKVDQLIRDGRMPGAPAPGRGRR